MILITYQYHNDKIINVKVSGHAYFANYGNDIVCAGISAILFGTLNALDKQLLNLETEIIVKEAASIVNISVIKPTSKNQIILATMYWQLKTVAINYPKNITITKEVSKNDAF